MPKFPTRVRAILIGLAGVAVLSTFGFLLQRHLHRKEFAQLNGQFKYAQVVPPLPSEPKDSSHTLHWKTVLHISGNVPITLEAKSFFGEATVTYSDESGPRVVAQGEDYIWPQEIRLDPISQVLYVRTSGLGAGIFPTTRLIAYDLKNRSQITRITLHEAEVPLLGRP